MHLSSSIKMALPSLLAGVLMGAVGMGSAAVIRGSSMFSDVPEESFFDEAVGEMYNAGVIRGYSNGNFGPNDFVTRGQIAVMMQRLRADVLGAGDTQPSVRSSSGPSSNGASSSSSSSVAASANEFGSFRFANAAFSLPETVSSLTLSVVRTGGSKGDATVRYTVRGGTAAAGEDFVAANESQLSFRDGETSKNFSVALKDDKLGEGSETVIIELSNPTGGASLGTPSSATLTILDNEAPSAGGASTSGGSSSAPQSAGAGTITFSALAYEVSENSAGATITVNRTGGSTGQAAVNYATSDKTARAGTEYTAAAGTLTFAGGETTKTFTVPVIDDTVVDGKKALVLTLSAVTGGATLGGPTATLSIADDEIGAFGSGTLMFGKSSFQATEGDGIATLIVNRTGGTKFTVGVSYATANGTALPGLDYANTSGTLSFAPGEQSKTFTVPIIKDALNDSGEYFPLTLSSPTGGAVLGDPSSALVNIYE